MSQAVQGVIEAVSFREKPAPDQWGKTHFSQLKVGGTYYDCGGIKPSPQGDLQIRVQNGKDWVTLEAGDTVQFFAKGREKAGKTYWDKDGPIKLVAKGNGAAPAQSAAPAQRAAPASPAASAPRPASTGPSDRNTEIKAGRAVNNAVSLHVVGVTGAETLTKALALAIKLERYADENYAALYAGTPPSTNLPAAAAPAPVQTPAPQPAAPQPVAAPVAAPAVEFNEDDIPF